MCLLKESCSRDSANRPATADDQLCLPCAQVIQSLSYKSEGAMEVQEAELIGEEVLAFFNPVEGMQRDLQALQPCCFQAQVKQ